MDRRVVKALFLVYLVIRLGQCLHLGQEAFLASGPLTCAELSFCFLLSVAVLTWGVGKVEPKWSLFCHFVNEALLLFCSTVALGLAWAKLPLLMETISADWLRLLIALAGAIGLQAIFAALGAVIVHWKATTA